MSYPHLTKTLVESFNALADEVQSLIDRKTILEHKLRYAHEQVCSFLAYTSRFLSLLFPSRYILAFHDELLSSRPQAILEVANVDTILFSDYGLVSHVLQNFCVTSLSLPQLFADRSGFILLVSIHCR